MKTLLLAGNILFLSVILFQRCALKTMPSTNAMISQATCVGCKDYTGVELNLLNADVAKSMAEWYSKDDSKNRVAGISGADGQDARSVWFSLETLKNFIFKIEDPLCKAGCTDLKLGLRIYYAKYPSDLSSYSALRDVKSDFANKHTVFLVATYNDGTNNIDFDPANLDMTGCRPRSFTQWFADPQRTFSSPSLILSVQNHGDLAPPPFDAPLFGN